MQTYTKIMALAVITIFVFGTVYAGVALEEADAAKAKKHDKKLSAKAKKGMLAQHLKYKK